MNGRGITRSEWESHAEDRVHTTLRALQAIADHLALVPGRKSLVWVSSGFPPWYGLTRRAGKKAAFPADVEQCVRAVSNANLAIYPVNARGLTIPPGFEDSSVSGFGKVYYSWYPETLPVPQSNADPMRQLAEGTGGRAYIDTNDLSQAIRDAVADSRLTYTLGYYAPGEPNGKFHSISVRVDRPGVELRYRSGYFNLPPARRDEKDRKAELQEAASSPVEATGIVILAELKPVPGSPAQLECVLRIEPQHVTLESQDGRWAAELDLLFVQNDAEGRRLTGRNDTLRLRLAESSYRQVLRAGIGYRQFLDVQPDAAGIRVVVRDAASGSAGSVTASLSRIR